MSTLWHEFLDWFWGYAAWLHEGNRELIIIVVLVVLAVYLVTRRR